MQANSITHLARWGSEVAYLNLGAQGVPRLGAPPPGFLPVGDYALDVHMRRWVKASINAQQELPL